MNVTKPFLEKLQWVKPTNHSTGKPVGESEYASNDTWVYKRLQGKYYRCTYSKAMNYAHWYSIPNSLWEPCTEYGFIKVVDK